MRLYLATGAIDWKSGKFMLAFWTVGPFGRTLVVILVVASFRAVLILCGQYCSAAAFVFSAECVSAEVALLSSRAVVMFVTVLAQ